MNSTDGEEIDDVTAIPGHKRTQQILASSEAELETAFRRAEDTFQHMGDRGDARESAVRRFLADQLPNRFVVTAGEVMDAAGKAERTKAVGACQTRREPFPWDRYMFSERGGWRQVAEQLDDAPTVERATTIKRLRARQHRNRKLG